MNILAVDCCLRLTGAALMLDKDKIYFEQEDLGRRQSTELPKMTEKLLRENNISWPELDYIALTNGPGYFTGIRVGAAYASGLAYACGVKIIPVSSLELLNFTFVSELAYAYGVKITELPAHKVLVLVYAGHGFVYAWCKNFLEPGEYSHDKILAWLNENPDAKIISDDPERTGLNNLEILRVIPSMKSLCELAREKINLAVNPAELKILYYRAPQGVNLGGK